MYRKAKSKRRREEIRQSKSLKTSIERKCEDGSRITELRERLKIGNVEYQSETRPTKVQMILERHRKMKNQKKIEQDARVMKYKVNRLTKKQRRERNNSNISLGPPQNSFMNFTIESAMWKQTRDYDTRDDGSTSTISDAKFVQKALNNNSRYSAIEQRYIEEDCLSEESKEESIQEESMNTERQTRTHQDYKGSVLSNQLISNLSTSDADRTDFYMNAPLQMSTSTFEKPRAKAHLPPTSSRNEEAGLVKNTPLQTKSSKLMKQLQQKKVINKTLESRNSNISKYKTSGGPFSKKLHRKNSKSIGSSDKYIILNNKKRTHNAKSKPYRDNPAYSKWTNINQELLEAHEQIFMNQTYQSFKPSNMNGWEFKLGNNHLVKRSREIRTRDLTLNNHPNKENLGIVHIGKNKNMKLDSRTRLTKVLKIS